jgi:hypothetical protein
MAGFTSEVDNDSIIDAVVNLTAVRNGPSEPREVASSAAVEHVSLRAEVKTTEAGNGKLLTPLGDTHFHRVMRLARAQLKPCMSDSDNLQEFQNSTLSETRQKHTLKEITLMGGLPR